MSFIATIKLAYRLGGHVMVCKIVRITAMKPNIAAKVSTYVNCKDLNNNSKKLNGVEKK